MIAIQVLIYVDMCVYIWAEFQLSSKAHPYHSHLYHHNELAWLIKIQITN